MQKLFLSLTLLLSAIGATAGGLVPAQVFPDSTIVDYPLEGECYSFRGEIELTENASVALYHGDELVAEAELSISSTTFGGPVYGDLIATFEKPLMLELGEEYCLKLAEGSVQQKGDSSKTNDAISQIIIVPKDIMPSYVSIEEGSTVACLNNICFYFRLEIAAGDCVVDVYREDKLIGSFKGESNWDYGLGYAGATFDSTMTFDKGVKYRIVLPAGTLHGLHRSDLVNRETSVSFIGGYTGNSGVGDIAGEEVQINVNGGELHVYGATAGTAVSVHTADGRLLLTTVADIEGNASATLERGIYIVAVDGECHKIIAK